ncbi:MAG: STAS domain-containing protein [Pseudobdellovibrionaceae bacterium]
MLDGKKDPFGYQLVGNDSVLIINFSGSLHSGSLSTLDEITEALNSKSSLQAVILNFTQVETLAFEAIPRFAQFLKVIRGKPAELRICSLKLPLKERLGRSGILRSSEITETTKDAIYSLAGNKQKVA